MALTLEQQACNAATSEHIRTVARFLHRFAKDLLDRADKHDLSKLESPEVEVFTEYTPKLDGSTFGSPEYEGFRTAMAPALAHHYARNSHHPEHYPRGLDDMSLTDIVEVFCDWKAASLRHHNGNLLKSIELNAKRFNMSDQLRSIFQNTAERYDG